MTAHDILADPTRLSAPAWDADTDEVLVCREVRDETADVRSFTFSARAPRVFAFLPGQFLTFDIPIGGETVNRCYTIASTPTRPHTVTITVKRVPGGPVSNWLHDNLRPGMELRASGPMGDFSAALHRSQKYLFLSGGSGITPLMSMARAHLDLCSDADILFVHSARSPADIIFRNELAELARGRNTFRAVALCETDSPGETWGGLRGRLSLAALQLIAPDLGEREVFTCGPAPYMAAVRAMLAESGFNTAQYHEESFDFATLSAAEPAPAEMAENGEKTFSITFAKSERVIQCGPDTMILDAARNAGMRLPFSCAKGLCGTCKSRKLEGSVEMTHAGGIRKREIDQGMILICCSRPTSDVTIER